MPSAKTLQRESASLASVVEQLHQRVGVELTRLNDVPLEERRVVEDNLHRPGLVLAGYADHFQPQRIQILGNTESRYLESLGEAARADALRRLVAFDVPVLIYTNGNIPGDDTLFFATEAGVPVLATSVPTTRFMALLDGYLNDVFAPYTTLHGSLVDVYGVGMLLMGRSGIGKSEVALDLVERGHRLVADDVVVATRTEETVVMGAGTDLVQHFMEIRGLGLLDIRAMFGVRAVRFQKRIEVVVQMMMWDKDEEYTRLGMADGAYDLLGVHLPEVKLPITPGKNVTVICEVIAMNYLLRHYGYDPATVFAKRLAERIADKSGDSPGRMGVYFENDRE
ncbi:MAG: HPr kinase/phosphorylase [Rhodothermales bacterium]|nr:HPr kinase/phosphorylase [Rhodothermales bacterium]